MGKLILEFLKNWEYSLVRVFKIVENQKSNLNSKNTEKLQLRTLNNGETQIKFSLRG